MRFKHNILDIKRRLIKNFKKVLRSSGTAKATYLMKRADILREQLVWDIQRDIQEKIDEQYRVYTDDKGSFFDSRYIHMCT
jgi:hypothetical protein